MSGSAAEREIRDYAVARLRQMIPEARIIHELVVGGCRADLAAVEPDRVTLVEIKSERDTLKRLPEQLRQFSRAAHEVVVIAHECWWDDTPYNNGCDRFIPSQGLNEARGGERPEMWAYPEVRDRPMYGEWRFVPWRREQAQPHAARLLELCWRAELFEEAVRHGVPAKTRTTLPRLIREMAWHMTGKQIAEAVCRQLRQRHFPEADAPISEQRSLAA